jgi:hypothetical protein
MSQIAKTEGRFHNPKVGGSIPPPRYATVETFTQSSLTRRDLLAVTIPALKGPG